MNPYSHASHELELDQLETLAANDPSCRLDATLLLLLAASLAMTGLMIVGGVTVTQHFLAWAASW